MSHIGNICHNSNEKFEFNLEDCVNSFIQYICHNSNEKFEFNLEDCVNSFIQYFLTYAITLNTDVCASGTGQLHT